MQVEKITPAEQKRLNKSRVYAYIYQHKQTSKQELSTELNLSLPTVSQNLKDLLSCGLIEKGGLFESESGRRPQIIQCCSDAKIAIGVDVLKETMKITAVNLFGAIIQTASFDIQYQNNEGYYLKFKELVYGFIDSLPHEKERILGIGIATQGIVSDDGASIIYGKIMNNSGLSLQAFSKHLDYPCYLIHDAEAAASAELWFNPNISDAVYLGLNRNIGGAVIIDRKLHRSRFSQCGSIEHVSINPKGRLCHCGRKGCLEAYCSGANLEKKAGMPLEEFFEGLRRKEPELQRVWKQYLRSLAVFIDNIRFIISGVIILDGWVASYFTQEDYEMIENAIQKSEFTELRLIPGSCKGNASALGAALYYIDDFLKSI